MKLSESVQAGLRERAARGSSVVELVKFVRKELGVEQPGEGRLLVMAYFTSTFGILLEDAVEIGGWVGFGDHDGETTDEELEELLGKFIRQ